MFAETSEHGRRRSATLGRGLADLEAELGGRPGRLLDVGASTGQLLMAAVERGWTGIGLEIDPATAKQTQETLGVPVRVGSGLEAIDPSERFELIVMSHWLEHVGDPGRQLELAGRLLATNGRLWIRVPNTGSRAAQLLRSRWSMFCPPIHLQYFVRRSFEVAASGHGLEIRRARTLRGDALPLPLELLAGMVKWMLRGLPAADPGAFTDRGRVGPRLSQLGGPIGDWLGRLNPLDGWEDSELQLILARSGLASTSTSPG